MAFCLGMAAVCWWQPDPCAALLIWPRWLWVGIGLGSALAGWHRPAQRLALGLCLLWLGFAALFVEEIHGHRPVPRLDGEPLRVVTVNCYGSNPRVAMEVIQLNPDLVLFTESPIQREVATVAQQLYGMDAWVAATADTSIIARGRVAAVPVPPPWNDHFAEARVTLANGLERAVIAARLSPYDLRADVGSPRYWRVQCAIRRQQRAQLDWLVQRIAAIPPGVPLIVGGDFNLAGNDALLRSLQPRLHDTFRAAGTGLGNTLINEFPFLRIDQIWASAAVPAVHVVARRTEHSDHRLVIADLVLPRNR